MQGFNEVLSNGDNINDSSSEAMHETVVQGKDGLDGNVAMAVREILKEMEVVPNLPAKVTVAEVAQEDLLIGEEDEELSMEVTEVEVVVME